MNKRNKQFESIKKIVGWLFVVGSSTFFLVFIITSTLIGYSVKQKCQIAQSQYEGDCVQALSSYLEDKQGHNLKERNGAVWALGQLGDERALPALEKVYTGYEGVKCRDEVDVCQYEVQKAIKLIKSGINLTAFVWRTGSL